MEEANFYHALKIDNDRCICLLYTSDAADE